MNIQPGVNTIIAQTRCWMERVVIDLNLCPFARKPFASGKVRFAVTTVDQPEGLCAILQRELEFLHSLPVGVVETTLLIHPNALNDFLDYNDFLGVADALLEDKNYAGEFQMASFHPHYQFAGTAADAAENYTNRSPYPTLHLLREESVERALHSYAHPEEIPERNIRTLNSLGAERMREVLRQCRQDKS